MCGICGFISKKQISYDELEIMNDLMYRRGPNDSGVEVYELHDGYSVGLAHRRLSIMDLSKLGHQPMHSVNKRVSVVFNGEIYNYKQIREELSEYPFKSHCDTEVIIAAYLRWGIQCVERFNGMFAIALYDWEKNTLFLTRDRMGKKPLFYWIDGVNIVFASELKPIMACSYFKKKINRSVISRYLFHQYINAPDTIFEDVYKLEPGTCLKFHNGNFVTWKYWDVATVYNEKKNSFRGDFTTAKTEFKQLLESSVKKRMISDVPLGTLLSGGYDSSLVTAVAQSLSDTPINTYSIGFSEKKYDESEYACRVAKYLGTNHTNVIIDELEMLRLVDSISEYYDEPFADSSQIPTMLVAKLARNDVTVVLSGDGGDELFCGYNLYELVDIAQRYDSIGSLIMFLKEHVPILGENVYKKLPMSVKIVSENRNIETKTQFRAKEYYELCERMVLCDDKRDIDYKVETKYHEDNWQAIRMLLDMESYLPGDILCKVDRATMKYSLEARCPLLDKDIVEFSYSIPHSYKYVAGNKKRILKEVAYDYIPKKFLDRPKVGFSVPLDKWLRGPLRQQVFDYTDKTMLKRQGIFDGEYIDNLIDNYMKYGDEMLGTGRKYSGYIWSLLVFQKWYEKYIG